MRKGARNWEETWRQVFHQPQTKVISICVSRERELCGFGHDRFINGGDSAQLMCIDLRFQERFHFMRCVDDGDDRVVTILNRSVIWVCLFGSSNRTAVFSQEDGLDTNIVLCYGCEIRQEI